MQTVPPAGYSDLSRLPNSEKRQLMNPEQAAAGTLIIQIAEFVLWTSGPDSQLLFGKIFGWIEQFCEIMNG